MMTRNGLPPHIQLHRPVGQAPAAVARPRASFLMQVYVLFGLLLISGALQRPIGGDQLLLEGASTSLITHGTNTVIIVIGSAFFTLSGVIALFHLKLIRAPRHAVPLFAVLGLAAASTAWSPDKMETLKELSGLLGCTVFALVSLGKLGLREVLRLLTVFAGLFIVGNLILAIVTPTYAYHQAGGGVFSEHAGRLRGSYVHKNLLGAVLLYCELVWLLYGRYLTRSLAIYVPVLAIGGYLLLLTGSAKSFVALPAAIAVGAFLSRMRRPQERILLVLSVCVLLFTAEIIGLGDWLYASTLEVLGRDATLMGRTLIWKGAIDAGLSMHPILGGSYGAAWGGGVGRHVAAVFGFDPGHAHNGFVQLFVELGFVGLALMLWFLWTNLKAVLTLRIGEFRADYYFVVAWLIVLLMSNLAGSFLMRPSDIYWFQMMLLPFLVRRIELLQPKETAVRPAGARPAVQPMPQPAVQASR